MNKTLLKWSEKETKRISDLEYTIEEIHRIKKISVKNGLVHKIFLRGDYFCKESEITLDCISIECLEELVSKKLEEEEKIFANLKQEDCNKQNCCYYDSDIGRCHNETFRCDNCESFKLRDGFKLKDDKQNE